MKVVILGVGRVGYNIARYMATEENDVTIVDQSNDLLQRVSDSLDVQPILGYASHPDVLKRAGVADADLLIALTGSDEVNIVACQVADTLYKVPKKIARVRHQSYLDASLESMFSPENLAIDHIISPEVEVAKTISRSLRVIGAFDVKSLWEGEVKIIGIRCQYPSSMLNTPLRLLPGLFPKLDFMMACVYRDEELFVPKGDDQLYLNDEVYVVAHTNQISEIMEQFHQNQASARRAVIIGGGSIGLTLALELEKKLPSVDLKVIERDSERAELIARQLTSTEVICGDGLDSEILSEVGIDDVQTVISITEDDKVNILSSLLVKGEGAERAMTLLNNMDYADLVTSMGIDAIISPHAVTVSSILRAVRQGQFQSVHSLRDGQIEVIEAEAREGTHVVGLSLEDITIKGKILVAGLFRENDVHIIPPKTTVRVGDRLILISAKESVSKVEHLFERHPNYL